MNLQCAYGVGHEVAGRGLRGQRRARRPARQQDHDGVVEHRRAAVDLLVGRHLGAVAGVDAADRGRDELDVDLRLLGRRGAQRGQRLGVGAVGDQDADLAAGEAVRAVGQDAQRRGRRQVA